MSDTQAILQKIAALRQRLDQAQGLVRDASAEAERLQHETADPVGQLEQRVATGAWHNALLDSAAREAAPDRGPAPLPRRLTARGARLLHRGRDLLHELRSLADEPLVNNAPPDSLSDMYHETAAMLDTVLRTVPAFPEAPSVQARMCDGLHGVLGVVADRLALLRASVAVGRQHLQQIQDLSDFLENLAAGRKLDLDALKPLAQELQQEAEEERPVRFLVAAPTCPARFVACHSLTVAQVIARLTCRDPEWRGRVHEPILAALLHDCGMVSVPAELLRLPGPLSDDQRVRVEQHTRDGGHLLERLARGAPWLIESAVSHHERCDGTGYPDGLVESQLSPLVRLLIVCDVYAARATRRPYRKAFEPRAAFTDTLLLADQGAVDKDAAERLLRLGFFPVGSVVELSDGSTAVVVGPPELRNQRIDPARPKVALLTDAQGLPVATPWHVDLLHEGETAILRVVPVADRRDLVGKRYPLLAA